MIILNKKTRVQIIWKKVLNTQVQFSWIKEFSWIKVLLLIAEALNSIIRKMRESIFHENY